MLKVHLINLKLLGHVGILCIHRVFLDMVMYIISTECVLELEHMKRERFNNNASARKGHINDEIFPFGNIG